MRKKNAEKPPKILCYEELEQRLLFSADVLPGLDAVASVEQVLAEDPAGDVQAEDPAVDVAVDQESVPELSPEPVAAAAAEPAPLADIPGEAPGGDAVALGGVEPESAFSEPAGPETAADDEPQPMEDAAGDDPLDDPDEADTAGPETTEEDLFEPEAGLVHEPAQEEETADVDAAEVLSAVDATGPAPSETRRELSFVNENVAEAEQLIADLSRGDDNRIVETVVLDAHRDGFEQVSDILAERRGLSAVHFVTHGTDGGIHLGNSWLTGATLEQNRDAIARWGDALTEDGDILFYGCDIAADSDGISLLEDIAGLTGADVAGSTDNTGHALLGGDWELEYQEGESLRTTCSAAPSKTTGSACWPSSTSTKPPMS